MPLIIRRIIFYFLLLLFLITTPLAILYTAGYRYNVKQNRILKTGAIFVQSDPKSASVYLNNRLRKERTPAKILNLTPGEYHLRLARDSYHSWQKTLQVESEQVAFADKVVLFKNLLPQLIASGDIIDVILDAKKNRVAYLKKESDFFELWLLDESPNLIWRSAFPENPKFLEWAEKNDQLLIYTSEFWLFDLKESALKNIAAITQKKWSKISFNYSQNLLIGLSDSNLYGINFNSGGTDLIEQSVVDFLVDTQNIFVLQKNKEALNLKMIKGNEITEIKTLPHQDFELKPSYARWIVLYDKKNNNLQVISMDQEKTFTLNGEQAAWFYNGAAGILSYNDFEVWSFTPANEKQELISRFSEESKKIITHPSPYFISIFNDKMQAIELDTGNLQNIHNLASFDKIFQAVLDKKGKVIYIAGVKNETAGLWRLEIR